MGSSSADPKGGSDLPKPAHVLAERSLRAVQLVATLSGRPAELAAWLYAYGRWPASAAECRSGSHHRAVLGEAARARLGRGYTHRAGGQWEYWELAGKSTDPADPPRQKLYLSPAPRSLRDAADTAAALLDERPAPAFKMVASRGAALRPDKLVVYFHDPARRDAWAHVLLGRIAGCPAHGVPFTAALDGDGLLSVAVDPRPAACRVHSWRSWCTGRIARSLAAARRIAARADAASPWELALLRLQRAGVDVGTWRLMDEAGLRAA